VKKGSEALAEGVRRLRNGEVYVENGFDGQPGRIKVFAESELKPAGGKNFPVIQVKLFRKISGSITLESLGGSPEILNPPQNPFFNLSRGKLNMLKKISGHGGIKFHPLPCGGMGK